jgi:hypothetical protein
VALLAAQHPMLLGHALGPVVVAFGLLAAAAGSALRSRPLMVAALVAVLTGVLIMAKPENLALLAVALVAMVGAAAALAVRATTGSPTAPPGDPADIERLRLLHGRTHMSCFAGSGPKSCLISPAGAVSYQVRWGVAVAAGDPLARGTDRAGVSGAFLALCTARRWGPLLLPDRRLAPGPLPRPRPPCRQVRRGSGGRHRRVRPPNPRAR